VKEDPWLQTEAIPTLKNWGFTVFPTSPDADHFGNWWLLAARDNVALRLIRDRGPVHLDLMPSGLFKLPVRNPESEWYTWDVVAMALGIPFKPEREPLTCLHEHLGLVDHSFSPASWEQTRELLARVEEDKRRRFTKEWDVPARDPVRC
jgi:hypothetical protein